MKSKELKSNRLSVFACFVYFFLMTGFLTACGGGGGGGGSSSSANVTPVANDDSATINEGGSVTINLAANDTDADDGLDVTSIAFAAPLRQPMGVWWIITMAP